VLVQARDSDVLPQDASTKDVTATLPSAVKNQALRDARSVWKRSFELGVIPVLRKPIGQWNNQNWRITSSTEGETLMIPVCQDGKVGQTAMRCSSVAPLGKPGTLRIKRKRGKWVAEVAYTLPEPEPTPAQGVMAVDLGVKVPAVVPVIGKGTRFVGNERQQRAKRRPCFARRKALEQAKTVRAVRKSQGKEQRWMRDVNQTLAHEIVAHEIVAHEIVAHEIVAHARQQGVGTIRLEQLAGIRQRTARTSRGANKPKARQNHRLIASWPFSQLAMCIADIADIADKAERVGLAVEWVDPAYTSQICPSCCQRNKATDRR
jgi:IS605 OrfB family transposase